MKNILKGFCVEKEKYKMFTEVLKRFNKAGILSEMMIAGSWNIFLYEKYFKKDVEKIPPIRTIDVDFLIPQPLKMNHKLDVPEILKDLGYVVQFEGNRGFIKLLHPDLIIEFIVPEKGKGRDDKPVSLPNLGVNAVALRFMNVLTDNSIKVKFEGITVNIAHPAALAFHYLLIYPRRKNRDKAEKNLDHAVAILRLLIEKKKNKEIVGVFKSLHKNWRKDTIKTLKDKDLEDAAKILE